MVDANPFVKIHVILFHGQQAHTISTSSSARIYDDVRIIVVSVSIHFLTSSALYFGSYSVISRTHIYAEGDSITPLPPPQPGDDLA